MRKFRCLTEAVQLYQEAKKVKLPYSLKDQLLRASSSIALNLSEGNDRYSLKDKRRFFNYALTSLREVQTLCKLENLKELAIKADHLGAMIYVLNRNLTEAVAESDAVPEKQ